MKDTTILDSIAALVEREHQLRAGPADGSAGEDPHPDLIAIEVELDRCWDLLRQRRDKGEFGADPDAAAPRSASVVEGYWQ
jgi:hypothetical protein